MLSVYVCVNVARAYYLCGKETEGRNGRKLDRELIPFVNFTFRYEFNSNCSNYWKGKLHW